jgi:hypothetical protein
MEDKKEEDHKEEYMKEGDNRKEWMADNRKEL